VLKLHANYNAGRANISLVDHKLFIFGHGKHKNSLDGRSNWNADNSAVTTFSALTSGVDGRGERHRSGRGKRVGLWREGELFMFKSLLSAVLHARKVSIALSLTSHVEQYFIFEFIILILL